MDRGMDFERTMSLLFGDKAYQIAGTEANPKHRREWLRKTIRELLRVTNALDATPRQKAALMSALEAISKELKATEHPSWDLVYRLVCLTLRLYGFSYAGARCYSLAYWQTPKQRHTEELFARGAATQLDTEHADAVSLRSKVVEELSGKNVDDFKIALVLNTSEHAVKQLRANLRHNRARSKPHGR